MSKDMRKGLDREFSKEEVDEALKQMSPFKSPGLDGFGAGFYTLLVRILVK